MGLAKQAGGDALFKRRTDVYLPPESGKVDPRLIKTREQVRGLEKKGLIRTRPSRGKR